MPDDSDQIRVLSAQRLAALYHGKQFRLGAKKTPYIEHCRQVAHLVTEYEPDDSIVKSAGWLHDVLEDTECAPSFIRQHCGDDVLRVVIEVTDDFPRGIPLFKRKALQARRMRNASHRAQLVKLADQFANVRELLSDPPVEWSVARQHTYVLGAIEVVDACRVACDALGVRFYQAVRDFRRLHP